MNNFFGEIVGYLSGVCTTLAFLPQAIKSITTKKRVGTFPVYVYHILHGVGVLDYLRCVFAFISNNVVQQHYTGVQWNNTIHDN